MNARFEPWMYRMAEMTNKSAGTRTEQAEVQEASKDPGAAEAEEPHDRRPY